MTTVESRVSRNADVESPPTIVDTPKSEPAAGTARHTVDHRELPLGLAVVLSTIGGVALLAFWFVLHLFFLSALQEHGSQARLYAHFRASLAEATAPLGGTIRAGSPVALLQARSGGLRKLVVVEGTTSTQLESGPGHLVDTPLPGQAGVSVIFGRSVTFGGPFGNITSMKPGDVITVTTGQGVFQYRVDRVRGPGSPLPPASAGNSSRLTLVTSASSGWRSGWAPDHAVYVDATMVGGQVQPTPSGQPTALTQASLPMRGNTGSLVGLVFWLEALLLVCAAIAWTWARWGRSATWIAGVPLLLAILWGASDAAAQLLPNLI